MDIKNLKALIKLITDTDITEFKMETGGEKLVIRRGATPQEAMPGAMPAYVSPPPVVAAAPSVQPAATAPGAPATPAEAAAEEGLETIVSPIVGTFYRSPSPDSDPYVEVGSEVAKGQILCIVEAMKLMNEIEAEFKCRIVKILKENAQPVEFGDPLFLVEPL
jgi:acetyl-CoA carboxylase biotin carboxyl carrier protein